MKIEIRFSSDISQEDIDAIGDFLENNSRFSGIFVDIQTDKRHLCDDCLHTYPECNAKYIIFGNGKGKDNVWQCADYEERPF